MIGIYKITNPNNRVYIGQSKNISKRLEKYYNLSCSTQPRLYRSLKKYGADLHTFEIIEECEIDKLNERERYYQELYDVLSSKGMNCLYTKTKDKRREANKNIGNKISKALTGRTLDPEHVVKIKIALSKRKISDKLREVIGKRYRGKTINREIVEKMKQTKLSQNLISKFRKEIIQTDLNNNIINIFNSIEECSKILNIHRPNIIKVLKEKRKTAGGFKFYYSVQNKLDEFREQPEVVNPELSANLND